MAEWQWKPGSQIYVDAQAAGERIEALRQANDGVTPTVLLADAKKRSSIFHELFEWDDATAAGQQRLSQARHILSSIVIVEPMQEIPDRAFEVVVKTDEGEKVWERRETVLSEPEYRAQYLEAAERAFLALRRKYHDLEELEPIFEAIDAYLEVRV